MPQFIPSFIPKKKIFFTKQGTRMSSTSSSSSITSDSSSTTSSTPIEVARENAASSQYQLRGTKEMVQMSQDNYAQQCLAVGQRELTPSGQQVLADTVQERDNGISQINETRQQALVPREESEASTGLIEAQADFCNLTLQNRFIDKADRLLEASSVSLSEREQQERGYYMGEIDDLWQVYGEALREALEDLRTLRSLENAPSDSSSTGSTGDDNGESSTGSTVNNTGSSGQNPVEGSADGVGQNTVSTENSNLTFINTYLDFNFSDSNLLDLNDFLSFYF